MKINILFVDDETDVIGGYKRMLFSMRNIWNIYFAVDGEEALKLMGSQRIDVVVTDMKMPGMDGAELLVKVKEQFPQVIRIILSGHQDHLKIVKSTLAAHQFLLKPCSASQIKSTIEKAFVLRDKVNNTEVLNLVNGVGELPTMPEMYIKLEKEISKDDISLERVKRIVASDPAITAKILQTVNSGFFGLPRRVTDLIQALSLLGVNTIKSIVLYLQTFAVSNYEPVVKEFCENLGKHSLKVAHIARKLAAIDHSEKVFLDDIYVAGILHDIGKLILTKKNEYTEIIKLNGGALPSKVNQIERNLFNVDHESIGGYLLGIWGLPSSIAAASGFHHSPMKSNDLNVSVLTYIHIADALINFKGEKFDVTRFEFDMEYIKALNLESNLERFWNESRTILEAENEK